MSPAQVKLLKRLIDAERDYRMATAARMLVSENSRWVETGRFVGIDPRTVETLVEVGLVETRSTENCLGTEAALLRRFES